MKYKDEITENGLKLTSDEKSLPMLKRYYICCAR